MNNDTQCTPHADPRPRSPSADLAVLRRYTAGDKALEREILELFLEVMPEHLNSIKRACWQQSALSAKDWHLAIHTIKGSAATIGARAVVEIAERMLALPFDRRTSAHIQEVARLEQALTATFEHVKALINN